MERIFAAASLAILALAYAAASNELEAQRAPIAQEAENPAQDVADAIAERLNADSRFPMQCERMADGSQGCFTPKP